MNLNRLKSAYSAESFRQQGHQLIDILADHLNTNINETNPKVIHWDTPKNELEFWKNFKNNDNPNHFFETLIKHSIKLHHPKYLGHQVTPPLPINGLSNLTTSILNNGMAVFEMGVAATAIEHLITNLLCKHLGYNTTSGGFLTSGGTLANLTAMLSARKAIVTNNVWNDGNKKQLGIMVSEQAHYCIDRAARIMGLGDLGIIKIPVGKDYKIDTTLLEKYYTKATTNNIEIFAIVGSAPSTATGIFDNLNSLAEFASSKNIWFHVDAAHGGGGIFSNKYKGLLNGISKADSVVIDGHKMLMMPATNTALLFKNKINARKTFTQKADYLLQSSTEDDWYNLAKQTFECTKTMMSAHWFSIISQYGTTIFDDFVTTLYDLAHVFTKVIKAHQNFEYFIKPMSNIVCFRYINPNLNNNQLNTINKTVRQHLLEDGEFYIVQTILNNVFYLRTTIMNPFTTENHFKTLLNTIENKALPLIKTKLS